MKRKYIPAIVFLLVFTAFAVFYFKYRIDKTEEVLNQLNNEYPSIDLAESIDAIILDTYHGDPKVFRNNSHHAYITLERRIKKRINASDELMTGLSLDEVLQKGTRLVKEAGSDQFFIYKVQDGDTLKHIFELRDDLGYSIRKKDKKSKN